MDLITALNDWLVDHQVLAIYVVLPAVTGAVSWFASKAAVKKSIAAAAVQRSFEAHLKLSDFHRETIDQLRDDSSEVLALATRISFEAKGNSKITWDLFQKLVFHVSRFAITYDPQKAEAIELKDMTLKLFKQLENSIVDEDSALDGNTIDRVVELCSELRHTELALLQSNLLSAGNKQ